MRRTTALPFVLVASLSSSLALADETPSPPAAPAAPSSEDAAEAPTESPPDEAPTEAGAAEPPLRGRLLVLELVDRGAGPELTRTLSEAFAAQAGRSSTDVVLTAEQLKASLDASALSSLSGCDAEACMQDFAAEVEADRVLGGSVALVGGDVVLSAVLVEVGTGERRGEAQRKVSANPTLATYATRALTAEALGSAALGEPVPVLLESDPPGARAYVDGNAVGSTPVVATLSPGAHEVLFRAEGHDEQKLGVAVKDGAPVVLHAQLTSPTVRLWPLAAALGGVTLLAAGGAGWAGMSALNAYDGSFALLTPEEDVARSYLHASPTDSIALAERQQQVEQLATLANTLWVTTGVVAAAAVGLAAADVALWALSE